jgi:hypothetical protein
MPPPADTTHRKYDGTDRKAPWQGCLPVRPARPAGSAAMPGALSWCRSRACARREPSGRPARPGRPGGLSPPRPGLTRIPLCPSRAAPVNADFFTPGCLLNARSALAIPTATMPPATRGRTPGEPGRNSLIYRNPVFESLFHLLTRDQVPERRSKSTVTGGLIYLACTFLGPFVYLRSTWGCLSAGPGRRTAVCREPIYMSIRPRT